MTLIDTLFTWISAANEALWGWCVLWLLVGVSIGLTFLLKGFQFRKWRAMFGVFGRESEAVRRSGQGISSFQAFCVSLGARVGTGNLAGVASAIAVGGPGAVFWMWVMALFGAATAFAEATLAQLYKRRGEGSFFGGPAYYMKYGLKCAPMGVAFAVVLVLNQGMASHIVQSNAICGILGERTGAAAWATAAVLAALALAVFFGGVRRVSRVSAVLVPFMALGFLALAAWVAVTHLGELPRVLGLIVSDAFGLREVAGGGVGVAVMQGVRRGLFSNEAGEGSAPNAAATADVSHPVKQGFVQALGVFADTLVVCTCTAAIILLAETEDFGEGGIVLTSRAMAAHVRAHLPRDGRARGSVRRLVPDGGGHPLRLFHHHLQLRLRRDGRAFPHAEPHGARGLPHGLGGGRPFGRFRDARPGVERGRPHDGRDGGAKRGDALDAEGRRHEAFPRLHGPARGRARSHVRPGASAGQGRQPGRVGES